MRSMLCLEVRPMHWGWVSDYVVTERQSWRWSWEPPLETPLETRSWGRSWNPVWDHPLATPRPGRPGRPARPGKFPGREIPGRPGARAGGEISPRKSRPGSLPGTPREPPPGTHFWASQGYYIHILLQLTPQNGGSGRVPFSPLPGGVPGGWPGHPPGRPGRGKKVHIFLGI